MRHVIRFSVNHPVSVLMAVIACVFCSFISMTVIQFDFMPKMDDRFLLVSSEFDGVSASDMRKLVTIPVEDSLASLKGVKNISSTTRDSFSLVLIELQWNTESKMALTECRQIIDQCYEILPSGVSKPDVVVFNPNQTETLSVVIDVRDGNLEYARYICDNDIKGRFQRVQGVSSVGISGGDKAEIHVFLDKNKIESLRLTLDSVAQILSSSNFEYPAGTVSEGNKEFLFKTKGLFSDTDDILNAPVLYTQEGLVSLSDIGVVKAETEKKKSFYMYNGKEAICMDLYKKGDSSPLALSKSVRKEIKKLNDIYGGTLSFTLILDKSEELKKSLMQLVYSALSGIIITILILLIFLRRAGTALLASCVMPLTILFSVLVLCISGKTVNILSVSGIAVGIGMVIDPAVVTIENILRNLKNETCDSSLEKSEVVIKSTQNVSLSNFASALTTVVVFVPFFFLPALTGKLFSDMAVAVISSICFASVLSLTFVPACMALFLRYDLLKEKDGLDLSSVENSYSSLLSRVFSTKVFVPFVLVLCLALGVVFVKFLDKEIMPKSSSRYTSATILYKEGTLLETIMRDSANLTDELKKYKFIEAISISGGIEDDNIKLLSDFSIRKEMLRITCRTKNERKCGKVLASLFSGGDYEIFFDESKDLLSQILSVDYDSRILSDESPEKLNEKLDSLEKDPQAFVSEIVPKSMVWEYVFTPDRTACARFGVSAVQGATLARNTLEGVYASPLYKKGREIPVLISYPKQAKSSVSELENTAVILGETYIPLSALGNIGYEKSEKILYRYNRKDSKKIRFAEELGKGKEQREKNTAWKTESFYGLSNPGREELDDLLSSSTFLLLVVLLLLYCVMGAQFESFLIPILMLLAIPPAFTGAFMALLVFGHTINLNSIIALVVLFGTSVNNSILLYEAILSQKMICVDSVISASVSKLRSILITTLTTICALIPFSVDINHTNTQASMSVAIIGGLVMSFVIVLFVVPPVLHFALSKRSVK